MLVDDEDNSSSSASDNESETAENKAPEKPPQVPEGAKRQRRRSMVVPFGPFETGEVVSIGMVGMEQKLKHVTPHQKGRRGSVASVFFSPKSEKDASPKFGINKDESRSKHSKKNKKLASEKGIDLDDPKYDGQMVIDGTPECECTTLMVRNIPNKYTQRLLVILFKQHGFDRTFDFLYVPVDFNTRLNVGYCFINFVSPQFAQQFAKRFHGFHMPAFKSRKKIHISLANLQGLQPNIKKLQDSSLMMDTVAPEYQPLLFNCTSGLEMPFPTPANQSVDQVQSRAEDLSFWLDEDAKRTPAFSGSIFPRAPPEDEHKHGKEQGPPKHHMQNKNVAHRSEFFHGSSPPPTPPSRNQSGYHGHTPPSYTGGYHTPPYYGGDAFGFGGPPGLGQSGKGKGKGRYEEWSPQPPSGRSFRGNTPHKQRAY
jgi:RNA recognition motif-containing protein